jgi:predicted acetyltransferase
MPEELKLGLADEQQRLAAFANVFECWPWAPTLEEHMQKRIHSAQHARANWYVGCLAGEVVVSLGSYPVELQLAGQSVHGIMIGAVHTVPSQRGAGHAPRLISWVEQQEHEQGAVASILFSDISTGYYERMGYQICPSWEMQLATAAIDGEWQLAEVQAAAHADQLARWYQQSIANDQLAIVRDQAYWDYLFRKQSDDRTFLLDDGGPEPAGFLRVRCRDDCWEIQDWGLAETTDLRLQRMVRSLAALAAREGCGSLGGWLPQLAEEAGRLELTARQVEITMIKPLDDSLEITDAVLEAAERFREIDHV